MTSLEITFWLSVAILFYCYVGYGVLLFFWNTLKQLVSPPSGDQDFELLPVTLIVAAFNEEAVLERKINNTREIDYPADRFQGIFNTERASDNLTNLLVLSHFDRLLVRAKIQTKK